MSNIKWRPTQDGKGYWALAEGFRLVVKEQDDYLWWYGVYEDDVIVAEGETDYEEDAKTMAENLVYDGGS